MRAVGVLRFRLLFALLLSFALLCTVGCAAEQSVPSTQPVVVTPSAPPLAPAEVLVTESPPAADAPASSEIIPVEITDATWGAPAAPVTIVAFLDLQCPFCARVMPTLEKLQDDYGPQRLRLVVKHLPLVFHAQARPAADAAQAVMAMRGPG